MRPALDSKSRLPQNWHVPESRLAKIGILVGIVAGILGLVLSVVVWRYPHSTGLPEFEGAASSTDEIAEFDEFITEHTGKRVHVSVTFPNGATIRTGKEGSVSEFVLGDLACDPNREICEHKYWYRVFGMRKNDFETVFGWVGGGDGWLLQGTYFVASGVGTGGIQFRSLQAVRDGSS